MSGTTGAPGAQPDPNSLTVPAAAFQQDVPNGQQAPAQPQTLSDTNTGFLAGVDPRTPPVTANTLGQPETIVGQSQQVPGQASQGQPQVQYVPVDPNTGDRMFTAAEVEAIRTQEKDKLYNRLEGLGNTVQELQAEREARQAAEAEALAEAERIRVEAEQATMTAQELIAAQNAEWEQKFSTLQDEVQKKDLLLAQEQAFQELQAYKASVLEANRDSIIPQLWDLITGNTVDEVNASAEALVARSEGILGDVAQIQQSQRQQQRGVAPVGAPPVGPMENAAAYEQYSADDLKNMDLATYAANRDRLLNAASPNFRG